MVTLEEAVLNGSMQTGPTPWTWTDVFVCMGLLLAIIFVLVKIQERQERRKHRAHA